MTYKVFTSSKIKLMAVVLEKKNYLKQFLRCILGRRHSIVSRNIRFVQAMHFIYTKIIYQ